jgi:hypothetical protein
MGCNRIEQGDQSNANPSTANTYVLKRFLKEIIEKKNNQNYFSFQQIWY